MLTHKLTRKTTFALTTSALTALGLAFVASAQITDGQDTDMTEPAPAVQDTAFLSADINANGVLDREEFVSYAVMKADEGEADYTATRESGTYDDAFDLHDANADGALSPEELKSPELENFTLPEESDTSAPDM